MINFFAEDVMLPDFDQKLYTKWLMDLSAEEGRSIENINYVFCSDEYLLEMNKNHLNHDYYTDIITFPLNEDPLEADIFISIDRVKENAQNHNVTYEKELQRVMVHGLLHLMGFDDKEESAKKLMRKKEDQCIALLG